MKSKLVCIVISLLGSNVLFAQQQDVYKILKKYETCDTASFIKTWYSKPPEKQIMGYRIYPMTLCRKCKGAVWYAYDIQTLETSLLDLSFYNSREKKIYLADSNNLYKEVTPYEFDPYMAPPYIWDVWLFPWNQRTLLTNLYKRIRQTNEFDVYRSRLGKDKIFLYANRKSELIERIVYVPINGGYDSVVYHYNYFRNAKTEYRNQNPSNRYFPVNNKNPTISLEREKLSVVRNKWEKRTIIKDSVLSKIIDGTHDYYLIDFWHLSCLPCRYNLQILDTAMKQIKNLEVVLVNVHDNDAEVKNYLNKSSYTFRNICDYNHDIEGYFKPTAYPTTILLDHAGTVIWRHAGTERDIGNQIRSVIQSKSSSN